MQTSTWKRPSSLQRSPHRGRSFAAARGFTLIELMVVMIIIVIAAFAIRPAFVRSLRADRERAAVRQVVALLSSARTEAVARGRLVRVAIAPRQTRLWAERQAAPEEDEAESRQTQDTRALFEPIALLGRKQVVLPEYLEVSDLVLGGADAMSSRDQMIYCYPDGRTSGATLVLTGATGQEFTIDLSPATGRVQLRAQT